MDPWSCTMYGITGLGIVLCSQILPVSLQFSRRQCSIWRWLWWRGPISQSMPNANILNTNTDIKITVLSHLFQPYHTLSFVTPFTHRYNCRWRSSIPCNKVGIHSFYRNNLLGVTISVALHHIAALFVSKWNRKEKSWNVWLCNRVWRVNCG
jgi:hypothetical protein